MIEIALRWPSGRGATSPPAEPGIRASISTSSLTRLRGLLDGSFLWDAPPRNLQDPLSFRTLPQVQGAARDALDFAVRQVSIELNASQGNPLVVADEDRLVSVGNFGLAVWRRVG